MAITDISSVVYSRVPWLVSPTDDTKVDTFICQTQYMLQGPLAKTDAEVEDEGTYDSREKLLTGLYTSYNLVCEKAMSNSGGSGGNAPAGNKVLKRAKADVTETEFSTLKSSDASVVATAKEMKFALRDEICNLAQTMSISLPLCAYKNEGLEPGDVGVGFDFTCGLIDCC
jgi:hypothetical protein